MVPRRWRRAHVRANPYLASASSPQDDRIGIADGLARGESVKTIAAWIGKSYQSVYRKIGRNRKPDGSYQP